MNILGIHGGVSINQHDPAAALIVDNKVVACIEEERLMRIKAPRGFLPLKSIEACLFEADLTMHDIDLVVHPGETYLDMPDRIRGYLKHYFGHAPTIKMVNHQLCHLASAFYHSGYEEAMCLSYDAYGDKLSAALAKADQNGIKILETFDSSNSLGVFYATMTSFLGFLPAEDEYKVMGLAAFGKAAYDLHGFACPTAGGYRIDNKFLRNNPAPKSNWEPFYSDELIKLCGEPRRMHDPITERHANIAYATQKTLESCALSLVKRLHELAPSDSLCLAGGVALNCSANKHITELPFLRRLFVQPAATDRGLALGAALQAAKEHHLRVEPPQHVYLGPTYSDATLRQSLELVGADYEECTNVESQVADMLAEGGIVGWFQGRSEFGPRALGHRSILADPRSAAMRDKINARIKYREEFRPFAPAVLAHEASTLFKMNTPSPYMTVAFDVQENWKEKLGATTHIDGTARVQTVHKETAPTFHHLISAFQKQSDVPVLLNTSFNVKGEPIVEHPLDALATFNKTGMDALCMGPFLVRKVKRPRASKSQSKTMATTT